MRRLGGRCELIALDANFYTVSHSSRGPVNEQPARGGGAVEVERTVVFIDLAGYTALVEAHGDAAAVEVSDSLVAIATRNLCEHGALIKTIGDAVMLGFHTREAALRTVQGILGELEGLPRFPLPSTGMHHGTVMERAGDLFGHRVNVAARLAAAATPGEVLCTRPVADAAEQADIQTIEKGALRLRNVADPVMAYTLVMSVGLAHVDPVCRMRVHDERHVVRHDGRDWRFCSEACSERFASMPGDFAGLL